MLAGFLYSKIVSSREGIETEIEVRSREIISRVSEHSLIEIVGVLVDNAYEACPEEGGTSAHDSGFPAGSSDFPDIQPAREDLTEEIGHFFENGFTTKSKKRGDRGLGLYRAKMIAEKAGGEITVGQEEIGGENYIQFAVVI